jgi:hypothetical protein
MNCQEQEELAANTCSFNLEDVIDNALGPIDSLLSLADEGTDINDFLILLRAVLEKAEKDMERLSDCLSMHLGDIKVHAVRYRKVLKIDGKWYHAGDLVSARLEPGKETLLAPDPGSLGLLNSLVKDPDSQNIILMLANILDFSRKLALHPEKIECLKSFIAEVHEELKKEFNKQEASRQKNHAA